MKRSINCHAIFSRDPDALFTIGEYRGRSLADWIESFARSDEMWIRRRGHRPLQVSIDRAENTVTYIAVPPRKKPPESERFLDYQRYRGDPRDWAMMRLSAKVGARRA